MAEEATDFEIYRRKFEMFNAYLSPHWARVNEAQHAALRGANDFSLQGLKALVLLNGGAVLLAPTAQKIFGDSPIVSGKQLLEAVSLFVIGLFAVLLAYLFAFVQQQKFANQMGSEREHLHSSALLTYFPPKDAAVKTAAERERNEELAEAKKQYKSSTRYQTAAIAMSILSLLAFAGGSVWLLYAAMCLSEQK